MQKLLIFYDSHTEKIIFSRTYQDYMYVCLQDRDSINRHRHHHDLFQCHCHSLSLLPLPKGGICQIFYTSKIPRIPIPIYHTPGTST